MVRKRGIHLSYFVISCLLVVFACKMPQGITEKSLNGDGIVMLKIQTTPNSLFTKIAKKAVVLISAPDMISMTKSLVVTDSSVTGTIQAIPAGKNRLFHVYVYDSTETMRYKGCDSTDIIPDSTVNIYMIISRVGGGAVINGTIVESDSNHSPKQNEGLVAYFPFNGNTLDESDNGFNAKVNSATLTVDRFGNPNKAYDFNGSAGMSATVNSKLSLSKFTISTWFKSSTPNYAGVPRLVAIAPPGQCNGYYGLLYAYGEWSGSLDQSKRLIGYLDDARSSYHYYLYYSKGVTDTNSWHHGAITFENGTLKFYIDGVLDQTTLTNSSVTQFSSAELQIGYCAGGGYFKGKLDEIRIYNRALNDSEIQNIYSLTN